jgi:hypothetical protein
MTDTRHAPNRRRNVTPESPTRDSNAGNVTPEGGGTEHPTLGGGIGFSREQETLREAGAR